MRSEMISCSSNRERCRERRICRRSRKPSAPRHRGIGADGLIVYSTTPSGASMRLLNADGSRSEISGNGVRCLGAWIASQRGVAMPGQQAPIEIQTEAGVKRLELLACKDGRYTFRAAMGAPEQVEKTTLQIAGQAD